MDCVCLENTSVHCGIDMKYEDVNFYYITNYYDMPLEGFCLHEGKLAKFDCRWDDEEPEYYFIPIPFYLRWYYYLYIHVYLKLWFIKGWGKNGLRYWSRWFYGKKK